MASPKGGVGKTVTAVHLAVLAARELGRRVLVADCDPNRSAYDWLAKAETTGVDVAAVGPEEARTLRRVQGYDLIVADIAGTRDGTLRLMLGGETCNHLLVPSGPEVMDLRPVMRVLRDETVLALSYALVLTKVPTEALPRAYQRAAELRASGLNVASTIIRRRAAVDEAIEHACTVLDIPGRHHRARHVEQDYRALAAEIFAAMGYGVTALRRDPSWLA